MSDKNQRSKESIIGFTKRAALADASPELNNSFIINDLNMEVSSDKAKKEVSGDNSLDVYNKCKFCGKVFLFNSSRIKHMRIHTGEKPYVCQFGNCNRKFSQVSNLVRHARIHNGSKPFTCTICDKSFTSSSNLKQHSNIHFSTTKRNKLICFINDCSKKYLYICTLKKHLMCQHKKEFNQIQAIFNSPNFNFIYNSLKTGNYNHLGFINFDKPENSNEELSDEEEERQVPESSENEEKAVVMPTKQVKVIVQSESNEIKPNPKLESLKIKDPTLESNLIENLENQTNLYFKNDDTSLLNMISLIKGMGSDINSNQVIQFANLLAENGCNLDYDSLEAIKSELFQLLIKGNPPVDQTFQQPTLSTNSDARVLSKNANKKTEKPCFEVPDAKPPKNVFNFRNTDSQQSYNSYDTDASYAPPTYNFPNNMYGSFYPVNNHIFQNQNGSFGLTGNSLIDNYLQLYSGISTNPASSLGAEMLGNNPFANTMYKSLYNELDPKALYSINPETYQTKYKFGESFGTNIRLCQDNHIFMDKYPHNDYYLNNQMNFMPETNPLLSSLLLQKLNTVQSRQSDQVLRISNCKKNESEFTEMMKRYNY